MLELLGSKPIQKIIYFLHEHRDEDVYMAGMARDLGIGTANLSRYVSRLTVGELVTVQVRGREKMLKLNYQHPLVGDLVSLLTRQYGAESLLRRYFAGQTAVESAFIYGSWASHTATAKSDIDLMVIGSIAYQDLQRGVRLIEDQLGRPVNFSLHTEKEWNQKRGTDPFIRKILERDTIIVKGGVVDGK